MDCNANEDCHGFGDNQKISFAIIHLIVIQYLESCVNAIRAGLVCCHMRWSDQTFLPCTRMLPPFPSNFHPSKGLRFSMAELDVVMNVPNLCSNKCNLKSVLPPCQGTNFGDRHHHQSWQSMQRLGPQCAYESITSEARTQRVPTVA